MKKARRVLGLNKHDSDVVLLRDLLRMPVKVVCKDNWGVERRLTVGKSYYILAELHGSKITGSAFLLKCNTNRKEWFGADFFEEPLREL